MSLTSALNIAQTALFNSSRQTSVVSRNISEASNPDYTRRSAVLSSTAPGAQIVEIRRATDHALFRQNLTAISDWRAQATISQGLNSLRTQVNGVDNASAPGSLLSEFQEELQTYAGTPSNRSLGENAVEAARNLVRSLNNGNKAVQSMRADIDREIATSVEELNRHLADFEKANNEIVTGTRVGRDVSDALDRRDALLKKISEYVPVNNTVRSGNDMMLTTAGGITLFETVPRAVTFTPENTYQAGMTGNALHIDGVPITPGSGGNTNASGSLAANLQLRDETTVRMQSHLDEIARGLISTFAETDPSGTQPNATGLFTWSGEPGLPADGTLINGLAGEIVINDAYIDNPQLLRDGGANGADYNHNTTGAASYSELLNTRLESLNNPMQFAAEAGLSTDQSLTSFSAETISWLEGLRQDASSGAQAKEALSAHSAMALGNETGVNVDEEMALLLELERSYEASARLMRAVDEMLGTLMEATR
ncbi:flagellar hook-associated protein FlgK [Chelativorans sp. YIM 93263]|uniref:flagellar hook-associated protein FlgK n=1 Tax=Chelativorans sp. YIM 93263 TaxID=2906648 RepID=UPI0023794300|nr:flagellar hook-associated protein FlgK [Chelativorans sp. YIM 93263]